MSGCFALVAFFLVIKKEISFDVHALGKKQHCLAAVIFLKFRPVARQR
jgi:hypothetical protein